MIQCPKCDRQNKPDSRFCGYCGAVLPPAAASTVAPAPPALVQPQPPPAPSAEVATTKPAVAPFEPLPAGALLHSRRYEIFSLVETTPQRNAYLVRDRRRQECPTCHSPASGLDARFCEDCGQPLPDGAHDPPLLLLWETPDRAALQAKARAAQMGLRHPGLLNVYDTFDSHLPRSSPCYYAALDRESGTGLTALPGSHPPHKVLAWLKQLAETLGYLHGRRCRYPDLRLEQVRLVGGRVKLAGVERIEQLPAQNAHRLIAQDVNGLAPMLEPLLAGRPLPDQAANIFQRAQAGHYPSSQALLADVDAAIAALRRSASLTWQTGRLSDVGQVREINEDSLLTIELARVHDSRSRPLALFAVADGMGGHEGGEVASALAVNTLARSLLGRVMQPAVERPELPDLDYGELLRQACLEAARAVHAEAGRRRSDMGTTLVAALLAGGEAYIANVGDSRAYRITQEKIEQITVDHTLVERLVAQGALSREEARRHPNANLIYRSLGEKPDVAVDLFRRQLSPGDRLLLCSDGLSGLVEDGQMHQVVTSSTHPQAACAQLIELANQAGGPDNITAIVVKVE